MTVRFPTSPAYWNLRAEQAMNKAFEIDPLEPVVLAVCEPAVPSPAPAQHAAKQAVQSSPAKSSTGLISLLTLVAVAGTVSRGLLLSHWQSSRNQLTQERSLLMLERMRGPSSPGSGTAQGPMSQLSDLVQGPGGISSANFQLGSNSFSNGLGEAIGSSGWVLESISEAGALISCNGQQQDLAVGGVF